MIDVLKRLNELESGNKLVDPNLRQVTNEQNISVNECGMDGAMMSSYNRPSTPASINITAGSGSELSSMLKDIMSLAGVSKSVEPMSTPVAHAEPETGSSDMDSDMELDNTEMMRSVIDKLNPKMDMENEGVAGGIAGGIAGAALTKSPSGAMLGYELGSDLQDTLSSDDSDEDELKEYNNTPADATDVPPMRKDAMLNKGMHNQDPAGHDFDGKRMNGTMPKAFVDTYESLMSDYRKFISEKKQ